MKFPLMLRRTHYRTLRLMEATAHEHISMYYGLLTQMLDQIKEVREIVEAPRSKWSVRDGWHRVMALEDFFRKKILKGGEKDADSDRNKGDANEGGANSTKQGISAPTEQQVS